MGSSVEFRRAFVIRLNQACDESPHIPAHGMGRQQVISNRLKVVPESVSKWFKGISMPKPEKMKELAELLEVDQSWLALGVKPEMDREERKAHAKESDGAVHYVLGLFMLEGAHCGQPSSKDPRSKYVDFYCVCRGSTYPIHVSLARELSKSHFEVIIPREYADATCLAVVPVSFGRFHVIMLSHDLIEEHKLRKSGSFALQFSRIDQGRYVTGADTWPRLRSVKELP